MVNNKKSDNLMMPCMCVVIVLLILTLGATCVSNI